MIKFSGAIFIIFSCISLSYVKIKAASFSLEALSAIVRHLKEMADIISFHKTPLPEIICSLKETDNDAFLKKVFLFLQSGISLHDAWEKASEESTVLPENAKKALSVLGRNLGTGDVSQETENIRFCIKELESIIAEANINAQKNAKMLKSFGVLSGLLIVILFI